MSATPDAVKTNVEEDFEDWYNSPEVASMLIHVERPGAEAALRTVFAACFCTGFVAGSTCANIAFMKAASRDAG